MVKLCIADPPYLGRGKWYSSKGPGVKFKAKGKTNRPRRRPPGRPRLG